MVPNDGPNDDLLERLFRASARREPTADEARGLREAAETALPDVPPALRDALEALAAQRAAGAPLGDASSWAWLVDLIAAALPGGEVVFEGLTRRLVVPGLPLSLTLGEGPSAAWRVAPPPARKRLTPDDGWRLKLSLEPSLEGLVAACEVHCVAGCCGTGAFEVGSGPMRAWLAHTGREAGEAARRELEATLAELAAARHEPVVSYRFNAVWPAGQCEEYLRTWHAALLEALR